MIFDDDMARECNLVSEDVVVADFTVVCDMDSYHEEVSRTNLGRLPFTTGAMKSAELANQVVITDVQKALFVFELYVLGFASQHCVFEDPVSCSQPSKALDDSMCGHIATIANLHVCLNYGERTNT